MRNYDIKEMGFYIKTLRMQKNMTQEEVADAIGLSQYEISRFECAQKGSGIENLSKLELFSEFYGISLAELIFGGVCTCRGSLFELKTSISPKMIFFAQNSFDVKRDIRLSFFTKNDYIYLYVRQREGSVISSYKDRFKLYLFEGNTQRYMTEGMVLKGRYCHEFNEQICVKYHRASSDYAADIEELLYDIFKDCVIYEI